MNNQIDQQKLSAGHAGRPKIGDYTDYRAFLNAFWSWKKNENSRAADQFSHASFAKNAGFRSRSFARLVLQGKRNLSADAINKFARALDLTSAESVAFHNLVQFNQSQDFEARKHFWEQFLLTHGSARGPSKSLTFVQDAYMYLTRFAYPILLTLIRQPHVSKSKADLAQMSGLKLTELTEGLNTLKQLGAIVQDPVTQEPSTTALGFTNPDDLPNVAVQTFHKNMAERAARAAELPPQEREFQTLFLPLDEQRLLALKTRIRDFVEVIRDEFGGVQPTATRVYGFNINAIPLTEELIRDSRNASQSSSPVNINKEETL